MKKILFSFIILLNYAYAQDSLNVKLLYNWNVDSIPGSYYFENKYNEIWGVVVNGREFAVIGSTLGTHFFDVTDADNIREVDFVPGAAQGQEIIHRDYHDYQDYLYMVSDEGASTLQIVDLKFLPDSVSLVYDSDSLFARSHNIFIDSANTLLYVCYPSRANSYSGMEVYSLAKPLVPELVYQFSNFGSHDVYVKDNITYFNRGGYGLYIYDFSDPANPALLGSKVSYPDFFYNHSGWATEDGNYYVFTDEAPGMDIKICDVSDPSNIEIIDTIDSGVHDSSMAHNVLIRGDYLYVSYYHDGLQIWNIADPYNAFKVGYYDTYPLPDHKSFRGAWGVYPFLPSGKVLVSDMQFGLFVFDASEAVGTSVTELPTDAINIYPNPARDKIYIQQNNLSDVNIRLFGLTGRTIIEKDQTNSKQIDISSLPAGIYFLQIEDNGVFYRHKLVKTN